MYALSYLISRYSYDVKFFDELVDKIVIRVPAESYAVINLIFHPAYNFCNIPSNAAIVSFAYLDLFELVCLSAKTERT